MVGIGHPADAPASLIGVVVGLHRPGCGPQLRQCPQPPGVAPNEAERGALRAE